MGYPTIRANRHRDRAGAASRRPTAHSHDLTRRAAYSGALVLEDERVNQQQEVIELTAA